MTCTLCQDPRCDADAAHEDHDGLTDWIATARAMDRCRVTLADQVVQLRDRALRAEAEHLEAEAPDTVRFTRAIKAATPYEERERELEAMWAVILADGENDHEEQGLMRLVADLLGISDKDSALARQRVQNGGFTG